MRFNPASSPPGLLHPLPARAFAEAQSQTKHAFDEFVPSPAIGGQPFTGMIVAQLQENADLAAHENRAGDDSTSHPTKDNRKFPAVTFPAQAAAFYIWNWSGESNPRIQLGSQKFKPVL